MIRNEIHLFFSKKNILALIGAAAAVLLIYQFLYIREYEDYGSSQIVKIESESSDVDLIISKYEKKIEYLTAYEPENERLEAIKAMCGIWQSFQNNEKMLALNWEYEEKSEAAIRMISKQTDRLLLRAPEGLDMGIDLIYNTTVRDWNRRMLLHDAYEEAGIDEPVNPVTPTGSYAVYDALSGTGAVFLVLALLLILMNYDIWSADFDDPTYKLLYTLPYARGTIFGARCFVHWFFSILGVLFVLGCLFLRGMASFGDGLHNFQVVNAQALHHFGFFDSALDSLYTGDMAVPIGEAIVFKLVPIVLSLTLFFALIQFLSFAWRNSMSCIITTAVLGIVIASKAVIPAAVTEAESPGFFAGLNPFRYFQSSEAVLGNLGAGIPFMVLADALLILAVLCGTGIWMKRREM